MGKKVKRDVSISWKGGLHQSVYNINTYIVIINTFDGLLNLLNSFKNFSVKLKTS